MAKVEVYRVLVTQRADSRCVEDVEKVKKGDTKRKVKHLLGKADSLADKEWIYYLDQYSGYVIRFDDSGTRVESVNLWVS